MELKTRHILFIAACLNISCFFSQSVSITPFNSSFWNAYADKIHLNDQDRLEFMSAHKKLNSGITATSNSQIPSSQKIISPTNSVLAGPCINADFELGNLTGWATSSGFHPGFNPLGCCP
ncbi:MAG: hypothetical protein JWO32_2814, partial [Bacteroidetes bacterium]|nr:hypothetical protein [Bacteroidota bacterium]